MKALIIILLLSVPKVGDRMTEKTDILVGQKWEYIIDSDNPFKQADTVIVCVTEIKSGYVLYSQEWVGHYSDKMESDKLSFFLFSYDNAKLIGYD